MTKTISTIAAAIAFLFLLSSAPAQAQASRTWVSGVGDDLNPCSRTAPCKTFAGAISKTLKGGEINMLDSGGFGQVTIAKSISIIAHEGVLGGVLVASTNAIIINITDPTDPGVVNLEGLDIEGLGATGSPGVNGIHILNAQSVTINKVRIRGFRAGDGNGINIISSSGNIKVLITNTSLTFNIRGVFVQGSGSGSATVLLDHVTITAGGRGIEAGANSTVRLGNSVITGVNSAFITSGGGQVISFGNNEIAGNLLPAKDAPTTTIASK
jgi:hypothetical protein